MNVHPRFMHTLDAGEFHDGFLALMRLMRSLYTDVMNNPADFGMPLVDAVEENPTNTVHLKSHEGFKRVPHILLILGAAGRLNADMTLSVSGKDLIAAAKNVKLVKMPEVLGKLTEYGFEIDGFTKTIKDGDELTIGYPDCRALITALKSMSDAQSVIGKGDLRRNNAYFYMMMPDILVSETVKEPKLRVGSMHNALNGNNRKIAEMFDECVGGKAKAAVKTMGFMRNDWNSTYTGVKSKRVLMTLKAEQDDLNIKLNLEHIGEYMDAVNALPDNLRDRIINNSWNCNQANCNPKCAGGFAFVIDGTTHKKCRCGAFGFRNVSAGDAAHLKTLLEIEMRREE